MFRLIELPDDMSRLPQIPIWRLGLAAVLATSAFAAGAPDVERAPLKVFILAGDSAMQGHAHVGSFDLIGLHPESAPMLKKMRGEDGGPIVSEKVRISSIGCGEDGSREQSGKLTAGFGVAKDGPNIGPEFTFGIRMQELLDQPVLIIKAAWDGKSLYQDFRPPGAGIPPLTGDELESFRAEGTDLAEVTQVRTAATGRYYRMMIDHVNHVLADPGRVHPDYDPEQGYELAGFVWFQGWSDLNLQRAYPNRDQPGGFGNYRETLSHLIRDVRKDLSAPQLPVVIGVMGVGGPVGDFPPEAWRQAAITGEFRKAMAATTEMPGFKGNVVAVATDGFWEPELLGLMDREHQLRKTLSAELLGGEAAWADRAALLAQRRAAVFTPQELEIVTKNPAIPGFHYLGSARIMGRIGFAFADAAYPLTRQGKSTSETR
jgi:hypothetical protein